MIEAAPIFVKVKRVGPRSNAGQARSTPDLAADLAADLAKAKWLANLLDGKWSFMGIRFGLDGLVGLIPAVGDTVLLVAALFPIHVAIRHRLGVDVIARMLVNVAIDYFAGLIPLAGDMFDVLFRANLRNVAILERAIAGRTGVE